ncbi:lysosome-associated membrane glycoprotein 1 [Aplysia californica]|uniref:Lysosome-associated membrane glycoprotein 5 n=1 Tax=Aplysia californica TaxID=6500 RepID=A0ABM0JL40_APLCA|nr:lysosome-associated membrane glycoprotein 1 [Aplysia californica]
MGASSINLIAILVLISGSLMLSHAVYFSYAPKGSPDEPCILLDIDFNITMKIYENGTEVATAVRTDDDQGITVQGSCGIVSTLILRFSNGTSWSFLFKNKDGVVSLDRLVQFRPNQLFGPSFPYKDYISFDDPGIATISDENSSYSCVSTQRTEYNPVGVLPENVTFTVVSVESNIRAQGFNVKDGQFGPPSSCSADLTSTSPVTGASNSTTPTTTPSTTATPSPPTTLQPLPPVNNYTVQGENSTCIVLLGAIDISITYEANTSTGIVKRTPTFQVPPNANASGDCDSIPTSQELVISFYNGWSLTFTFDTDKETQDLASEENMSYRISNITVTYVIDQQNFPDAVIPEGTVITAAPAAGEDNFPSKSGDTGFYKCNTNLRLTISDDVKMDTRFLEFKAFNADGNANFSGNPNVCNADGDSDNTIPIIVGSVLGGLLLIVIVIFFVCRYKRNSKYQEI